MKKSTAATIRIQNKIINAEIVEGKPVLVRWSGKSKTRAGVCMAVGWIKAGERPGTVDIVHQAFQSWDLVETEYSFKWTVWIGKIIYLKQLGGR